MVNKARREFLTEYLREKALAITGAFLLPPVVSHLQNSSHKLKQESDIFEISSANSILTQDDINNEKVLTRKDLETKLEEYRKKIAYAPSQEEILRRFKAIRRNGVLEKIEESSSRLDVSKKYSAPILCIEHGSPYQGSSYGGNWISPSGCRGIAQLSFGAFFDVVKWYNDQNLDGNYPNSPLEAFLKSYRKYNLEFSIAKKELIKSKEALMFTESDEAILRKEIAFLDEDLRKYLKEDFNKLFLGAKVNFNGKIYDTTSLQIEIMQAYLKRLHEPLKNWDFTIGAYNHGLGAVRAFVNKYEGRIIPISLIGEVIEENSLEYENLFNKKHMLDYFSEFKQRHNLSYMDRNYVSKVKIAELEILLI